MRVQVLSFRGCPHHERTVARVRQALASAQLAAPVDEIWVSDTDAPAGFAGSPTVLVNGRDVEPAPPAMGPACRRYADAGAPSLAALARGLDRGQREP
ncbi:MAG: DF family (seleno)protein [Terriglobales bacterium]